jgi:hypothetical protein
MPDPTIFTIEDSPMGLVRLFVRGPASLRGVVPQGFTFEGKDYKRLEFTARFRQKGKWEFGSFHLCTPQREPGRYVNYVKPGTPTRSRLVEQVRDLITQWWVMNGTAAVRATLLRDEERLKRDVDQREQELARQRCELAEVQKRLAELAE